MTIRPCPVCGSGDSRPFAAGVRWLEAGHSVGAGSAIVPPGPIVRCQSCGLGYRTELPSPDALEHAYRTLDDSLYERELSGRRRTAASHRRIVEAHVREGRILDVGCASGIFLDEVAGPAWDVVGVEPSASLAERARTRLASRGTILNGALAETDLPPESFDVVTAWDVVEHVSDPIDFLRRCAQRVRPGGYVLMNVPDLSSLPARLMGAHWPLLLPAHLHYFDRTSLTRCAESAGLVVDHLGRRPAWFSLGYLMMRLSEHGVPLAGTFSRRLQGRAMESILTPLFLGELYAVCRREGVVA